MNQQSAYIRHIFRRRFAAADKARIDTCKSFKKKATRKAVEAQETIDEIKERDKKLAERGLQRKK